VKDATDHTFGSIERDARPGAEQLDFTTLDAEVLDRSSEDCGVIRVPQAAGEVLVSLRGGKGGSAVSPTS